MYALLREGFAQSVDIPFEESIRISVVFEFQHLRKINDNRRLIVPENIERGIIAVDSA
jgi:hypothetical protein